MKNIITKLMGFLMAAAVILIGISATEVQAAKAKPVISSKQTTISNNTCTVQAGKKVKLIAKSGKNNITKKGTWNSSKKSVATVNKSGVLSAKKAGKTFITVKYNGKKSRKLKAVVYEKNKSPETTPKPAVPESDAVSVSGAGTYTITYDSNGGGVR